MACLAMSGVLASIGLVGAGLWLKQEALLFKPVLLAPETPLASAPDTSEVSVSVDGARLSALHLKRDGAKGLVFFLHGNAGNLKTWFVNADFYRQANFDLFMVDYRGYGKSTGAISSEEQLRADVRAAYAMIAPQYAGRKVVVYGRSLGSGLAAGLAQDRQVRPPDLTVLVSPYSSLVAAQVYPLVPEFLIRYPLRTDHLVSGITSPLLLFHGAADAFIAPGHSVTLKAIAPKAELVLVPGAGHNDLQDFPVYRARFAAALSAL
jgi:uncharacterized protein